MTLSGMGESALSQVDTSVHILGCTQLVNVSSNHATVARCLDTLEQDLVQKENPETGEVGRSHRGVIRRNVNKLGAAQNVNRCIYLGRGRLPRP